MSKLEEYERQCEEYEKLVQVGRDLTGELLKDKKPDWQRGIDHYENVISMAESLNQNERETLYGNRSLLFLKVCKKSGH